MCIDCRSVLFKPMLKWFQTRKRLSEREERSELCERVVTNNLFLAVFICLFVYVCSSSTHLSIDQTRFNELPFYFFFKVNTESTAVSDPSCS